MIPVFGEEMERMSESSSWSPGVSIERHLVKNLLVFLASLLVGVFVVVSSVSAATTRAYTGSSFGPEGPGGSADFKIPQAVAVDQADGSVYVLDAGEGGKLYRFNAAGEQLNFSGLGGNVIEGVGGSEGAENEIAIAPPGSPGGTAGDIYVANNAFGSLQVYAADGKELKKLETNGETCGVATDSAGHVFVGVFSGEGGTVSEYVPTMNPLTNADKVAASTALLPFICNVGVDGLGTVYASNFLGSSTAKLAGIADLTPTSIEPGGATLAVDPVTNDLYLDQGSSIALHSPSGDFIGRFGSPNLSGSHGVAIGSAAEKAYVTNGETGRVELYGPSIVLPDVTTEPATEVGVESAVLHGTESAAGGPGAACKFELTTTEAFKKEGFTGATSVECAPQGPFSGSGVEAVSAVVGNLNPSTRYTFRLVASNSNGSNPGAALGFRARGPSVGDENVLQVTATTARVDGLIDPNGEASGYRFEYGPTESYGSSVPVPDGVAVLPVATGTLVAGSNKVTKVNFSQGVFGVGQEIVGEGIAPGTTVIAIPDPHVLEISHSAVEGASGVAALTSSTAYVAQGIIGLAPGSSYHFRLVAVGAAASGHGEDRAFRTYAQVSSGLPDGRAYEMVSPVQKLGEVFAPEPSGHLGGSCTECLPGINDLTLPMQPTPDGDALAYEGQPFSTGLAPSRNEYVSRRSGGGWVTQGITPPLGAAGALSGFKAISPDLSRGVLFQSERNLSPEAPSGENGKSYNDLYLWQAGEPAPALRPLVTQKPPHRIPDLPQASNGFELAFAAGNSGTAAVPAFDHLVFEANDALTDEIPGIAPAAPEVEAGACGGQSEGTGFTEGDCNLYEWVGGQLRLINVLPGNTTAATHAVIGSGRRLAKIPGSESYPGSQAADVDHAVSAGGERIFWSDEQGQVFVRIDGMETKEIHDPGQFLTASVDGSRVLLSDGCLYSVEAESCVSLGPNPSAFRGILGASEDISRIYFVDTEALAAGAQAGSCTAVESEEEKEGKVPAGTGCNVYAYDHGSVKFVATLFERDNNLGLNATYGAWKAARSNRTAQVTPDGEHLAFMSQARLTGFDNLPAVGGKCGEGACREVFEYDLNTKTLTCPSCNPTGEQPLGHSNLSLIRPANESGPSFPQPENLPADGGGRLFFESQDTLSPEDENGRIQDVYEWTPDRVGGCEHSEGCVALISSGHSPGDSMFLNATPDASNVFFVTREQLLVQDKDELLDVYDARVGGGINTDEIAPCSGETCKGPASRSMESQAPGSSSFSGPGNPTARVVPPPLVKSKSLTRAQKLAQALKACAKKTGKKRRGCRAQAIKRYGPIAAKSKSKSHKEGK